MATPQADQRTLAQAMTWAAQRHTQMARIPATHPGDFTNVLIAAWARVCRVLDFYRGRIAVEGYLDSAVEPFSVIALAAMVGQQRIPAISASAYLAVRVTDIAGQPDRLSVSPDHPLVVQNVPPAGQLPVVFESYGPIELRAVWNALPVLPDRPAEVPTLRPSSRSIRLAGTDSGARAGMALYLRVDDDGDPPRSWLVTIAEVVSDRRQGCTIVTWTEPLGGPKEDWAYPVAEIVLLSRNAGLFGNNAAAWSDVPAATQTKIGVRAGGVLRQDSAATGPWRSVAIAGDVAAMVATPDDILYAVGSGAWRSDDHGVSWRALALPSGRFDLLAVTAAGDVLYAGDVSGKVLQSSDGGTSWTVLPPTVAWTPPTGFGREMLDVLHLAKRPATNVWPLTGAIRSLVITAGAGNVFAGTDHGVLRRAANDLHWTPFNDGFAQINPESGAAAVKIAALAEFAGWLVAATDHGLFASPVDGADWFVVDTPTLPAGAQLHDLAANVVAVDGNPVATLFVASSAGIAATPDLNRWADFSIYTEQGNPGVHKLAATSSGVIAATDGGVTRSGPDAARWSPWAVQELDLFTTDLSLTKGLDEGKVGPGLIARFARFPIALSPDSQVVVIEPGKVWDVTQPGDLGEAYRLFAEAGLRVAHRIAIVGGDVGATAMTSQANVIAVAPSAVLNTEWPDFTTGGSALLLDRKAIGIDAPGQLALVLSPAAVTARPALRSIAGNETVAARGFGKQATVTRVLLERPDLPAFDPRAATAWFDSRPVAAHTPRTVAVPGIGGDRLTLDAGAAEIVPGRRLIVSGSRPRAAVMSVLTSKLPAPVAQCFADIAPQLDQAGLPAALKDSLSAAGIKLSPDAAVDIVVPASLWLLHDGGRAWRLDTVDGAIAITSVGLEDVLAAPADPSGTWTIATSGGERQYPTAAVHVVIVPATPDTAVHAEIVTVAAIATAPDGRWHIDIQPALRQLYDRYSCSVSANVVAATQGEAVPLEILGTGQPSRANQMFRLHRGPLSYARDADGTPRPLLTLEVNGDTGRALRFGAQPAGIRGEAWSRTTGLPRHDANDRVYELMTDANGSTFIRFGDGHHGARLPSGENNIVATYRVGAGRTGNVAANTLTALRKRVPGIRSVANPLAATGGAEAESIEHLRARTRERAMAVDRVVTIADHTTRALAYPGIQSAAAAMIARQGEDPHLLLTVVSAEPVTAQHDWAGLRHWIEIASPRRVTLKIVSARTLLVGIDLVVTLMIDADGDAVLDDVRARLVAAFDADGRPLGVPLDPIDIAVVAKSVPGVERAMASRIRPPDGVTAATPGAPDRIAIDPAGIRIELRP
ncbi:baseplate J/gp47 family protein [Sphingomonas bacterium]|uniref:baseplate J/gp47 family protein n=1 Tax=Sphingomonas bacterium TaxID=1895847 RepID=UPI00261085D8|nr:baseplate J/gp47 family protein [Sphingomonas bacterium]